MINLLPPQQKEELRDEKKLKLILILGIIISAFLVSLSLILFAIKISFSADLKEQKTYLEQKEKELESPELQELEEKIKKYNLIFSQLEGFYNNQPDLISTLGKILQFFPKEIYLTALNFNPQTSQASLSGFSPNSEILIQFKNNLKNTKELKEVVFDPADWWLEATSINFTVKFKIEKQ